MSYLFYCTHKCVCHCIRPMFGVLGIYNFDPRPRLWQEQKKNPFSFERPRLTLLLCIVGLQLTTLLQVSTVLRCLEILCQIAFNSIANYFRSYRKSNLVKNLQVSTVDIYTKVVIYRISSKIIASVLLSPSLLLDLQTFLRSWLSSGSLFLNTNYLKTVNFSNYLETIEAQSFLFLQKKK